MRNEIWKCSYFNIWVQKCTKVDAEQGKAESRNVHLNRNCLKQERACLAPSSCNVHLIKQTNRNGKDYIIFLCFLCFLNITSRVHYFYAKDPYLLIFILLSSPTNSNHQNSRTPDEIHFLLISRMTIQTAFYCKNKMAPQTVRIKSTFLSQFLALDNIFSSL